MADGKTEEGFEKELTAKQRKNRKKKEAAKRRKQEQNLTESEKVPEKTREKDEEKSQESSETAEDKFHRELNWCIEQLEMGLAFQKPDKKQAEVVHRHLRSLKSSKTPLPRKRQLMFSLFGDYRKKMQEDQRKQRQEPAVNPKLAVVKQEEQKSIFVKVCQTKATDMNSQKDADNQDESGENNWKFQKSDNNFRFEFGDNSESASS